MIRALIAMLVAVLIALVLAVISLPWLISATWLATLGEMERADKVGEQMPVFYWIDYLKGRR